jgi:uncharacterized protein with PIN domain
MAPEQKRFAADVMLGRLAKWLRIIGYDTLYFRDIDDSQLIRRAVGENRILLTRDTELHSRGGFQGILIAHEGLENQLNQVIAEARLRPRVQMGVRCPLCNETLTDSSRDEVRGLVPQYVLSRHHRFARCPRCGKIFWRGTHWEKIQKRLRRMGLIDSPGVP